MKQLLARCNLCITWRNIFNWWGNYASSLRIWSLKFRQAELSHNWSASPTMSWEIKIFELSSCKKKMDFDDEEKYLYGFLCNLNWKKKELAITQLKYAIPYSVKKRYCIYIRQFAYNSISLVIESRVVKKLENWRWMRQWIYNHSTLS